MSRKQIVILIAPVILLISTYFSFKVLANFYGPRLGYFLAFVFYWLVWCYLFPVWVMGLDGIKSMFKRVSLFLGKPFWLGIVLLLLPPLLAGSTVFVAKAASANWVIILVSLGLAVVNATGEEILWRGVYTNMFPNNILLGYFYPSVGFALWHISPQVVHTSSMPGGVYSFVFGALILGLCWGWAAWKTKSIRWSVYSHILTDFLGLGATIYFTVN